VLRAVCATLVDVIEIRHVNGGYDETVPRKPQRIVETADGELIF
jgi:hypothetical protein